MEMGIIGAGSWGTALACLLARKGYPVSLWVRDLDLCKTIVRRRVNPRYLPGVRLPPRIRPSNNLQDVLQGKDGVILAVPTNAIRETAMKMGEYLSLETLIISAAKGLEEGSMLRPSQILHQVLPSFRDRTAVLSGPNHAEEVSIGMPSATVVASQNRETAELAQEMLIAPAFRVYTNPDLVGVELGGALKNIIALGAGVADGLGFGDNTLAALMTRGLVEITRLGQAMGARPKTFSGLSGIGDLFVTCFSKHSRNRRVGVRLGKGEKLSTILRDMNMVAEGVNTANVAYSLSRKYGISMPITEETYAVLFEGKDPKEAVKSLMERDKTREIEDIAF